VVEKLLEFLKKNNVKIKYDAKVKKILVKNGIAEGILLENGEVCTADKVILATGGASYPGTGSTGDGYKLAKDVGHNIIEPKPSLVGLITKEDWVPELQGLSLKNVAVNFKNSKNKIVYSDFGEMLFTHFGISGPVVLSGSRAIHPYIKYGIDIEGITAEIDLKPALTPEKLDLRIQRDFEKYKNKQFKNSLNDLLPEKLVPVIVKLTGIDEEKQVNSIKKEERKILVNILKSLTVTIKSLRPLEEAIVTAGGINIHDINPSTMESKIVKNLYFCGEVIDVDAYTGGFNLQIAFSTGYLAGNSR
jgi:predicted Rossmann fold flavoprotein